MPTSAEHPRFQPDYSASNTKDEWSEDLDTTSFEPGSFGSSWKRHAAQRIWDRVASPLASFKPRKLVWGVEGDLIKLKENDIVGKIAEYPENVPTGKAPFCPDHRVEMLWDSTKGEFECGEAGCDKRARKRIKFEDAFPADGKGAVYRGAMTLVIDVEGKPYLYLNTLGALIDLTQCAKPIKGGFGVQIEFPEGIYRQRQAELYMAYQQQFGLNVDEINQQIREKGGLLASQPETVRQALNME
jgi:hypothetical protein